MVSFGSTALGEPLTLADAIKLTLTKNRELEAFSWEQRASDGKILQAGLLPNPQLSISPENVVGNRYFRQQIQNTIEISQLIELGDKRNKRTEVAKREKERVLSEYEIKRNGLLAELNQRFVHVLSEQEMLKVMQRAHKVAQATLNSVRTRISAGAAPGYEEPQARVLVAQAKIQEEHAEHKLLSTKKLLASSWDEEELNEDVSGDLLQERSPPELAECYRRLEASPTLSLAHAEEQLRRAILSLEEARRVPDLNVALGWRYGRDMEDQAGVASMSIPLAIFDRNQGGIAAASAHRSKANVESIALPVRLKAVVFELYLESKHAHSELALLREEIIPQSEKALKLLQEGFRLGRYTFLELTMAQHTVIENKAREIRAALNFHKVSIELTQLVGGPNYDSLE